MYILDDEPRAEVNVCVGESRSRSGSDYTETSKRASKKVYLDDAAARKMTDEIKP